MREEVSEPNNDAGQSRRGRRRGLAAVLVLAAAAGTAAVVWSSGPAPGGTGDTAATSPPAVASANQGPEGPAASETKAAAPGKDQKSGGEGEEKAPEKPAETPGGNHRPGTLAVAKDAELAATTQPVARAVPLEKTAKLAAGTVSITKLEAIEAEAKGIGEIAGPALRFTLSVQNASDEELALGAAVVTVEAGPHRQPATELSGSGAKAFPAAVAPGKSGSGTFVFQVPEELRDQVRIYLNYAASESVVAFKGAAPSKAG